ncbi:MAG: FimB/Mfa2 family fimbrial subunit [Bacteroidales bacterium]
MTRTHRILLTICIFILFVLQTFSGCSEANYNWNAMTYNLRVAFINSEGNKITPDCKIETLLIYIYNSDHELLDCVKLDLQSNEQQLSLKSTKIQNEKELILYAVTASSESRLIYPEWDHSLSEFMITYPSTNTYEPINPIFSGMLILRKGWRLNENIEIPLERKVGNVQITLNASANNSIYDPDIYDVEIKHICAKINIGNNGLDSRLQALIPFTATSPGSLSTNKITMFPTETNKGLTIDIRKNGIVLMTLDKDNNNTPFECINDKLLDISIDLNNLKTFVSVKPWENIDTDIEI